VFDTNQFDYSTDLMVILSLFFYVIQNEIIAYNKGSWKEGINEKGKTQ
jgi:hypothetical protein